MKVCYKKRRGLFFGSTAFSVVCATMVALAQQAVNEEESEIEKVHSLGEILVLGSRTERNLLEQPTLESESLDIATSVVTAEEIKKQNATTLAEALDLSTGVFTETRGRKEKTLSSFRGQIYPYPDFALNGVWQRSYWEIPSFFPAAAIGKIEVLRSGGALMVGPNAGLVGAVNIVPRRFDEQTTIFDMQGGSYGTYRGSVVHGDRFEKGDYTVGASHYSTDGPSGENAGEHFTSFFGTGGWDAADRLRLELTVYGLRGEREMRRIKAPGQVQLRTRTEKFDPVTSVGSVLRALGTHSDRASTELDFAFVYRNAFYHRSDPGKPLYTAREKDWEFNTGVIHAHELFDNNILRMGVQYNYWECPNGKRDFVGNRMSIHTLSGVLMDEHQFDRLTLDGGFRLTQSWYHEYTESSFNIAGDNMKGRRIEDEWGDPAQTLTIGAKYNLLEGLNLYGHLAGGTVNSPPGAAAVNDRSLDREWRTIADAGVMLEDREIGRLSIGGFATLRNDAIVLSPETLYDNEGNLVNGFENSDVYHYGLEAEGRTARFCRYFSLFANATLMESQKRDGGWHDYREMPNAIVKSGVSAEVDRFDINFYGKYLSDFENKRFSADQEYHALGDFFDLNVNAGYTFGKEMPMRLYISLQNILDDRYSTVVGYPDYGFQMFAGVQLTL